jgi:hypothetical protein
VASAKVVKSGPGKATGCFKGIDRRTLAGLRNFNRTSRKGRTDTRCNSHTGS